MLDIISSVLGLVGFVCFILVIVKMFQNGQTGLGIAAIVLTLCRGIGYLFTFIVGWIKSGQLNAEGVMLIWTVAIIASIVMSFIQTPAYIATIRLQIQQLQQQMQQGN